VARDHGDDPGQPTAPAARAWLPGRVKKLCERYGALYIAESGRPAVRSELWASTKHGVNPDILFTGKGISGGMSARSSRWLGDRGRLVC